MTPSGRFADAGRFGNLDKLAGLDVVDVGVERDAFRYQRVAANARNIIHNALRKVADGVPLDEFSGRRTRTFAYVMPALPVDRGGLQAFLEQTRDYVVRKQLQAAIRMVDDKPFPGTHQLARNHHPTKGILTGAAASVANDVRVPFGPTAV